MADLAGLLGVFNGLALGGERSGNSSSRYSSRQRDSMKG